MVGRLFLRQNTGHISRNNICKRYKMNSLLRKQFFLLLLVFVGQVSFAQPSSAEGKGLFAANCAQCHARNMKTKATGPALAGVEERWADYPQEDLYNWIKNSQKMITQVKHPRAVELWNEYQSVMQAFPNLSDDNIASILLYINEKANEVPDNGGPRDVAGVAGAGPDYSLLYWVLFGVLGALALILARIIGGLDKVVAAKDGTPYVDQPLLKRIFSKRIISFALFAAIVIGGYNTVTKAITLGRQQGYAPEQPIEFSHETHAGVHKIDCQYCHDGARRSKHSVIPAANTCMNCHSAITTGSKHGTAEITKIYASVGFDPSTGKYIEDYEKLERSEIEAIYKKWIGDTYVETNSLQALDKKGTKEVERQWDALVTSLTNEQKTKVYGPIEWVRIHNLPDHVYFNHAQHVTVGNVECQDCHGKVEEMAVVQQHAPLSMGWCINCHRQTEVKAFEGNNYYASYKAYHDQLSTGDKKKVAVEDIGGLECQKCHY